MGRGAGFGGPDDQLLIRVVSAGESVPVECQVTSGGVAEDFTPPGSHGDVVFAPPAAEVHVVLRTSVTP